MTRLKPKEIREKAEADFGKAWIETGHQLSENHIKRRRYPSSKIEAGKPHIVFETANKLRKGFLSLGFTEVLNPVIVDEAEMFKQYNLEAPAVLDRCYYLAVLERPDVGLGREKIAKLRTLERFDEKKIPALQTVLHSYKKGEVDGDDLIEKIAEALEISDVAAMHIMEGVFPSMKSMTPIPTKMTLRSHMTTAWFLTLSSVQGKAKLPVKLFSVDVRFRREQQEDATHLKTHHVGSAAIMSDDVCLDDGKLIVEAILGEFGFKDLRFKTKSVTAKYYAPGSEIEVFVPNVGKREELVEVADFGLYAPTALANYDIEYPVLNVGIGVERLAMVVHGYDDVRKLAYPQFYEEWKLSDRELATMIRIDKTPKTLEGQQLLENIISVTLQNRDAPSPCSFTVFEGSLLGRHSKIEIYENDTGVKLIGPASLNTIYIYNSAIVGIPEEEFKESSSSTLREIKENGLRTGITYLEAIANLAAAKIEETVLAGGREVDLRIKMAKLPSDVNLTVDEVGQRYITSKRSKIDVRGPVFVGVRAKISDN